MLYFVNIIHNYLNEIKLRHFELFDYFFFLSSYYRPKNQAEKLLFFMKMYRKPFYNCLFTV